MISTTKTIGLSGLEGELIEVQIDMANGIPTFEIVGLPDISVRESKERIKSAIKNSGIEFPSKKIIVNLAPATTRKEGSGYDLPIAIGILKTFGKINNENLENTVFIGELSLDGKINRINGILVMCIEAYNLGIKKVIIPKANEIEASMVKNIEVIGVRNLDETIKYLNKEITIENSKFEIPKKNKSLKKNIDFSEIIGQENAKRALEIASAGGHNCLLIGSPGCGKTMLARRIRTILPDLTFNEMMEITKIHSISGELNEKGLATERPFRNPHHTISKVSMIGGGKNPKPGEISLAHLGVLFLDELPEFKREVLDSLRGPLEDGNVTISRIYIKAQYPTNFILIASMNPCPCGNYGSSKKECICSEEARKKYMSKISEPLLDRIDMHIQVEQIEYKKISENRKEENSETIKARVNKARNIQLNRYKNIGIYSNSELTPKLIKECCSLNYESKKILEIAYEKMHLSLRAYNKIIKIARTIADLDNSKDIQQKHIAEAIQYRVLDKKYGDN